MFLTLHVSVDCVCRVALGKHLKKLHPDKELAPDDPDHSYFSSTTSPPAPVAKRQKVTPVVRAIVKKKLPYVKSLPMKLPKGKKKKKLPKGKERKGLLVEKGVKLRRLKRFGCARLRTIADYHREQRQREAEELMNVTIPAGTGAMAARLSSSSKHNREAVSMVDLDHCYARVDEPSVYTTRVRIENDSKLKMTVFAAAASSSSMVTPDKMDAAASSDTISARSTPSPDGTTLGMQDPILEGASKLVSMLRQQMESGEIGSDLANLLPVATGTMAADIQDEGIVGLDLMDDGRNIEQQLTDILDSMQQETSPGGASGQHSKTTADASMAFGSNASTDDVNLESDIQLEACDVVAEHTTLEAEGAGEGEGYGMDVDEIELGEADYQLWQENHNSGANIEVQDGSSNLPDTTSCSGHTPAADQDTDSGDNSGDEAANDSCGDEGISSVPSEKQQQQPCLVDHQYY